MTAELEEFLENSFRLKQALAQVLPTEAVDYIIELLAKDRSHRNYLKIVEENET